MITLAEYAMDERNARSPAHLAKMVLCITSYHFTQTTQEHPDPVMVKSDLIVQLKMMSTAFVTAKSHNVNAGSDIKMTFDRNGIMLPYDFFMEMLSSTQFQEFMQRTNECYQQEIAIAMQESDKLQDLIYKDMMDNANGSDRQRCGAKRHASAPLDQIDESLSTQRDE
jgi:hypothetical protein